MAARELDDLSRVGIFLDFESGTAHGDAGRLGLVAAGDDATVVVREHDDLLAVESGVKHPLTGHKEVIAVNQAVHVMLAALAA